MKIFLKKDSLLDFMGVYVKKKENPERPDGSQDVKGGRTMRFLGRWKEPVSYTHLDVYKRQEGAFCIFLFNSEV